MPRFAHFFEDKQGNIWFGSGLGESEGLIGFDGKTLTRFKPNGDGWVRSMLIKKEIFGSPAGFTAFAATTEKRLVTLRKNNHSAGQVPVR